MAGLCFGTESPRYLPHRRGPEECDTPAGSENAIQWTPRSCLETIGAGAVHQDRDQGKLTAAYSPEDWLRYRTYYCQLIEKADACLGTVLGAVADMDNTVVAYMADHGDTLGEHGLPFKGPFMYEPLIRVPMVIRAPGRLKPEAREDLVTSADLAPTLASLAGLKWPTKITGLDLTRERNKRRRRFSWNTTRNRSGSIRSGRSARTDGSSTGTIAATGSYTT